MGFVHVLTWAQYALHPYAVEEFPVFKDRVLTLSDAFFKGLQDQLTTSLDSMLNETAKVCSCFFLVCENIKLNNGLEKN